MLNKKMSFRWGGMVVVAVVGLCTVFFPLGCTMVGIRSGYEEAGFTLIEKRGKVEIRDYQELVVVETRVDASYKKAGNTAFRRLFKYISGENQSKSKIAMTAPVIADESQGEKVAMTTPVMSEEAGGGWRYMFVLPASYTLETAPAPLDSLVKLSVIPARKVAVIRYAGTWKEEAMRKNTEALLAWVAESEYEAVSEPRSAGYDPPWTIPPFRRNEVLVDIE
jgi:DNA gyrase inhibitor GyrI